MQTAVVQFHELGAAPRAAAFRVDDGRNIIASEETSMSTRSGMAATGVAALIGVAAGLLGPAIASAQEAGGLIILDGSGQPIGACPLKNTTVDCEIVGFLGRTHVMQTFTNEGSQKIEAIYVFPLPQDAAVDSMVMLVGGRRIVGQIKEREEARATYEAAKSRGHIASLLDQERPNIFTQAVANLEPGASVVIEISFCETLKFEDGVFEWVFPMVVGPRYNPAGGSAPAPLARGRATPEVPDGDRITPPITLAGTRAGHDIGISVRLTSGMPLAELKSELHEVTLSEAATADGPCYTVTLDPHETIPNRDFILRYRVVAERVGDAFFACSDERGDFFTLILQPPGRIEPRQVVPRELIFVLDTSGSMQGTPIEKAKDAMSRLIDTMNPADTFNIITFAGQTQVLWERPRPNSTANRNEAQRFLEAREGRGGTEMMKAIDAALRPSGRFRDFDDAQTPIRVVCFMTDGFVGNDLAIIDAVKRYSGASRVFSFGIGSSVNRFLLDGMAHAGRGAVEYVTPAGDVDESVTRFHERILSPVLTDIEIDWGGLAVTDVTPAMIPDLFSARPIVLHGRLAGRAAGEITLRGRTGAGRYEESIPIAAGGPAGEHDALPAFWARSRVGELMNHDLAALQRGEFPDSLQREITRLGLSFNLITQFTSFVAVEERIVTRGGEPITVHVPVEMPEGVSYEGVFGGEAKEVLALGYTGAGKQAGSAGRSVGHIAPTAPGARLGATAETAPHGSGASSSKQRRERNDDRDQQGGKLAARWIGLADRVSRDGREGTLSVDGVEIRDYRVNLRVQLRSRDQATLDALRQLGFEFRDVANRSLLITGRLDVRQLEALCGLEAVLRVEPL